jgi:hypothetical protein
MAVATELSNDTIERISREAAGIVCERIGGALMKVGVAGMLIGLGCIAVGTYMNRCRGCHKEGSPMVIKCTDVRTGAVTRFSAPAPAFPAGAAVAARAEEADQHAD